MGKLKSRIKITIVEIIYIFYNYFVCNIPFWFIRKLLYQMGGMKIGKKSIILMKTKVIFPWRIKIGDRATINECCFLDGRGGLEIGNDASISIFTILLTGSHDSKSSDFAYKPDKIIIGENVWIGARSIILAGAELKYACLIGAGSTVKKGVYEENTFYSGVPAVYIKPRGLKDKYELNWTPWFR